MRSATAPPASGQSQAPEEPSPSSTEPSDPLGPIETAKRWRKVLDLIDPSKTLAYAVAMAGFREDMDAAIARWEAIPSTPDVERPARTESETADAWREMESAPHGGGAELVTDPAWVEPPEVLLLFEGNKRCVGRWDAYYGPGGAGESETQGCGWLEALTLEPVTLHIGPPIKWMPLPGAPK